MKNLVILILLCLPVYNAFAQVTTVLEDSKRAQEILNEEYTNPETTILSEEVFENFKGLEFYQVSEKYIVFADFVRTPDEVPFEMLTTTDRKPIYVKYGEVHFTLEGEEQVLSVYQEVDFAKEEEFEDYLFLPFTDMTSGDGTYGGGRYMDLRIPEGDVIILDFNRVYNPYCAYSEKYSCPVPPSQNNLEIPIRAGVKYQMPE